MQRINIFIGQTWKRQTKVHIFFHLQLANYWGRGQSSFPIFQFPLFRATPLSHSFTPFLKISSEPPFQPPPLKKRGRGVWTVLSQSLEIGQNSDRGISDFQISGQSLIKINCHNSWTSDDTDIKLELVTKLDKRNKTLSKNFDDDVMLKNCDVIVIFSIYGNLKQSGGQIPDA